MAWIETIDRGLDRIWRRLGSRRLIVTYIFFGWMFVALACAGMLAMLCRMARVEPDDRVTAYWMLAVFMAAGCIAGLVGSAQLARPLRNLDIPVAGASPEDLASTVLRLPARVGLWNASLGVLVIPPVTWTWARAASLDFPAGVAPLLPLWASAMVLAGFGAAYSLQVVCRPILRHLLPMLGGSLPSIRVWGSTRRKILLGMPFMVLVLTAGWVMVIRPPGTTTREAVPDALFALVAGVLFCVPTVLLYGFSTLQPLGDILRATERLKADDFSTPVPELSRDEYGEIARSLNEAMVGLAERRRLADEKEHLLHEVRASRARVVAASDAERRRVERNIHDGAQQQLVALSYDLRLLEMRAHDADAPEVASMARQAAHDLAAALDDLRELARGLHPSVLATAGLRPALEQLTFKAPIPIEVNAPDIRLPEIVESTFYFVASEAIANTSKYAAATLAHIRVSCDNGCARLDVEDDGVGGAAPKPSSGLSGLADRVEAIDGTLVVVSPPGGGTRLIVEAPLHGPAL